jgi:hypothetical protein
MGGKGTLKKWAGKRASNYRDHFEKALLATVNRYPVHVRIVSAQGSAIVASQAHMLRELGLAGLAQPIEKPSKKRYLRLGPFNHKHFDVPERQAAPLIFICHLLLRKHQELMLIIRRERPDIEWVDWQLSPNKFPGDVKVLMSVVFSGIMQGAAHAGLVPGNISVLTFTDPAMDVLADNVAGLFASRIKQGRFALDVPPSQGNGASLLWEVWHPA